MDLQLNGKTAVVTGASRGIGLATVRALLAEGADVVAIAHAPTAETEALAAQPGFRFVAADLTDAAAIESLRDQVGDRVDALVNNVGSAPPRPGGFASITDHDWLASYELNTLATVRVTRALLDLIPDGGAIVNMASENAMLSDPLVMDYSAAKAAVLSFSKSLSKELGPRGIRVNSVSPGPVATALWLGTGGVAETVSAAGGGSPEEVRHGAEQAMVTGRFTTPEEVAALITMLASPVLGNMTGSDVVIDGGMRQTM
ncbi:SDR family oxidoreductase [Leifsonia shinshuensis]|uniref:SDR family NAD(P)-dependent oxidoreductase n=1 Tax=Leifsonia shinshuensis TaxID=150026 RepID=UPI002854DCB9|nr:SDR family oxidoreductase [Leifsonia shinshuensis]MDR6972797.1 NAD(P)-dependent dehydrogenase (short-subunit alcohol dehydrogenase family) [Leifsonia shinshuensis]